MRGDQVRLCGQFHDALASPEIRDLLNVAFDVAAGDQQLEAIGAGLELARGAGNDPHRVQFDQVHQLVNELHASRTGQHDVDILGLAMSVSEGLTTSGLDDQIRDPRLFCREIATGETGLLHIGQAVPRRRVVDVSQILLCMAHVA
jgi:hypothetical protein